MRKKSIYTKKIYRTKIYRVMCLSLVLMSSLGLAQEMGAETESKVAFKDPVLQLPDAIKNNYVENFDYPNANIKDLVQAIAKMTGKNFILDPNVRGKISIVGPSKVTIQEAYYAFLTALEMNNLTIVPMGSFMQITFSRNARKSPIPLYTGDYSPPSSNYITRLYPLRFINADSVRREFSDMTTSAGKIYAYTPTNSLIITDTGANIQRIISILKILDVEGFQERMVLIPIQFASAGEIASLLDTILEEGFSESKTAARRGSQATVAAKKTSGGGIISKIIADDRTNSLIVLANDLGIKELKKIIAKLDVSDVAAQSGNIHVYYCQYANAADLAKTLSSLITGAKAATRARSGVRAARGGGAEAEVGLSGDIKITADTPTNSLVITASREEYESVIRVLEKLDIPRSQVFVEAVFLEVSINKGMTFDLSTNYSASPNVPRLTGFVTNPGGLASFLAAGAKPETAFTSDALSGFVLGFTAGKKIELDVQGKKIEIGSIQGLLTFLQNADNTNVLSRPTLMAMDNEDASIAIKSTVPSTQGFTTSVQGNTQNITQLDTGIQLKITPQINAASGRVKLKLSQSVSEPSKVGVPQGLQAISTGVQSREANTTVVVPDGDTVVIGGLIRNSDSENKKQVPVVGDIPILGWLFKSAITSAQRTNLLMFITPHIVSSREGIGRVRKSILSQRKDFINKYRGGKDIHEEAAIDLYNNDNPVQRQARIDARKRKSDEQQPKMQNGTLPLLYPDVAPSLESFEPAVLPSVPESDTLLQQPQDMQMLDQLEPPDFKGESQTPGAPMTPPPDVQLEAPVSDKNGGLENKGIESQPPTSEQEDLLDLEF